MIAGLCPYDRCDHSRSLRLLRGSYTGIEPDPIPAIAIVTIVTIIGMVNSDVSICLL